MVFQISYYSIHKHIGGQVGQRGDDMSAEAKCITFDVWLMQQPIRGKWFVQKNYVLCSRDVQIVYIF